MGTSFEVLWLHAQPFTLFAEYLLCFKAVFRLEEPEILNEQFGHIIV